MDLNSASLSHVLCWRSAFSSPQLSLHFVQVSEELLHAKVTTIRIMKDLSGKRKIIFFHNSSVFLSLYKIVPLLEK